MKIPENMMKIELRQTTKGDVAVLKDGEVIDFIDTFHSPVVLTILRELGLKVKVNNPKCAYCGGRTLYNSKLNVHECIECGGV